MKALSTVHRPQETDLPYRLRRSRIHGRGAFAVRPIKKGERIVEYVGERISHAEADRRHEKKADDDGHTFLFTIDDKTVIDAGVGGNSARFINHSCDGNCEVIIDRRRIFVEAIRPIAVGEELSYDYRIGRSEDDPPGMDEVFACRCGAPNCRGTMLAPLDDEEDAEEEAPVSQRRRKKATKAPSSRKATKGANGAKGGRTTKATKAGKATKATKPARRRRAS